MSILSTFGLVAVIGVAGQTPTPAPTLPPGTTPNIDAIAMGLCYTKMLTPAYNQSNCAGLWDAFKQPFLTIPQEDIVMESFDAYLSACDHDVPRDRAMFWSGTSGGTAYGSYDTVHALADRTRRYWTLEDTMWGGLVNGLNFCSGDRGANAFNFTTCPTFDDILNRGLLWVNQTYRFGAFAFWPAASKHFALKATGHVTMLVYANGGRPIYRPPSPQFPGSIFATIEIFNLQAHQIDSFTVMVITEDNAPEEVCGRGSLVSLVRDLTDIAKIPPNLIKCEDDPDQVAHLLCVDDPTNEWCLFARNVKSSDKISTYVAYAGYGGLVGVAFGYVFALLHLICCGVPRCLKRGVKSEALLGST
jgi:hypothetical protein